jgi:glycosidase
MHNSPTFEFHISRAARDKYRFSDTLFSITGNVVFANIKASRDFAQRMNQVRDAEHNPELAINAGALNAMALVDEILHALAALYREQRDARAMIDALAWFESAMGKDAFDTTLLAFTDHFPPVAVYQGRQSAREWLAGSTGNVPHRAVALEELMMLWLANKNPAFRTFEELFEDELLAANTSYATLSKSLRDYFETRPKFGPDNQNLVDLLRAPALASPDSLAGQLAFIREKWSDLLGDLIARLLTTLDVLKEEEIAVWMRFHPPAHNIGFHQPLAGDSSAAAIPHFNVAPFEYEAFSPDVDWMPRTVMMAKSVHVWLDQLSKAYRRSIRRLNEVPDEELNTLARRGFNALWLIGVWERSRASQRIKQMMGNPEAAASAYSLFDYTVAEDLGGESACANLRDRAAARGIRLASDMVPNHMGIDSRWVIEHPDWFLSLPYSPYPAYSFNGPDIGHDGRVEIKIEDHYYDRSDAAVVFRRVDRWTGDTRYVYHGNDGTSFPWNDTAQLNYLKPEVREAVIQNILRIARMFPIIRFDAAMTLTKQHYQRLWFPIPGTGGGIPSRAEHGMSKAEFDAAMPAEFWREVVDRAAVEAPGTLLLAEAFWLLEGYFVRTLGMHRVYNSAFMNMLRDEENANYRSVIKNTLEFDPEVLKRYVNFMNNPDERTAVDQFGKGDKYFGVCTMLATLPGLPMFGHGQIEGYTERYGMEYRRAYHDELPDGWLVERHEREITPLLHRRALFADVREFRLYDFYTEAGFVNEDVFAYSNRLGDERALIVYHNRYADTRGWIRVSCAFAEKMPDGKRLRQSTLGESFGLSHDHDMYVAYRDHLSGLQYLHRSRDLAERGLHVALGAYQYKVLMDWRDLRDDGIHPWGALCDWLGGRGVSSLEDALRAMELKPVHDALRAVLDPSLALALVDIAKSNADRATATTRPAESALSRDEVVDRSTHRAEEFLHAVLSLHSKKATEPGTERKARLARFDIAPAVRVFRESLQAAMRVPELQKGFPHPWPDEAIKVLPSDAEVEHAAAIWSTVLAWCTMQALGHLLSASAPDATSATEFDELRLREPMAEAFKAAGLESEERWRAAARVRSAFAHAQWGVATDRSAKATGAPFTWLHDPDVAWLIGAHEHEGIRYFNKEQYERLLWWMALRKLLALANNPDSEQVRALQLQIEARMKSAAESGYRVEALFANGAEESTVKG